MLSVPDWSKKIAPAEWGIDETEQKDISEVFSQGLDVQLEKINALRGAELAIVVVLSIAAGAWLVMFIANTFFATKTQENKVVTRRAKKKVVKEVEKIVPAPWESMVDTTWLLDNCRNSTFSSFSNAFSKVDFPAFVSPIIATGMPFLIAFPTLKE